MKKIILSFVAIVMALNLQGCDDREVAIAIGIIGGAIIGGAVGAGAGSGDHRTCHGDYVRRCTEWRDRSGNCHTDCRNEWDSCAHYYGGMSISSIVIGEQRTSSKVADIAESYHLSFESAEMVVNALEDAQMGNYTKISKLGVASEDMKLMLSGKNMSESAVQALSSVLNQEISDTRAMLDLITSQVQKNKQAAILAEAM